MRLPAGGEMHTMKNSMKRVLQLGYVKLAEVHVDRVRTMRSGDILAIHHGQSQLDGQIGVYATQRRACVHQRGPSSIRQFGTTRNTVPVFDVKSDIDVDGRPEQRKHVVTEKAPVIEEPGASRRHSLATQRAEVWPVLRLPF